MGRDAQSIVMTNPDNELEESTTMIKTRIAPMLWFDGQAEEAAKFYVSVFRNSKIKKISRYGENMPMPAGTVMVAEFELDGQPFTALNGGPQYKFSPATSFVVNCEGQTEVDYYWEHLTSGGGAPVQCGWLTDKFGLSWQVVPVEALEMFGDPDRAKSQRAMGAMMQMVKLDVDKLRQAYEGG
jgi:predicted 3-demethylubiquinone-9 3-methyltransferase (glyoxalase superfamily)